MQHTLVSKNFNFTQQNTRGGVTFTRNINPAPLFQLGALGKGEIKFTVVDLSMTLLESKLLLPLQFKNGSYWLLSNGDKAAIRDNSGNINLQGEEITYTKNGTQMGKFIVYKAEKRTDTLVDVYAYDRLCLFDKKADDWWNNLKFPITVQALLQSLCAYVGVSCRMEHALNLTMQVQKTIQVENTPCSDFLSWICEATGTFATCDAAGTVVLDFYRQTNKILKALTGNEQTAEEREEIPVITPYEVSGERIDAIDKLRIKSRENDIGKIVGDGTNAYIIDQNPLFFGMTDAQLTKPAQVLFDRVKNVVYTNFNVSYYNRKAPDIRVGDVFVFHTRRGNVTCYAQHEEDNGEKSTLQSAGEKSRIQVRSVNKVIQQLQGKSNEIVATVEELSFTLSDLGDYTTGLNDYTKAQFKLLASGVTITVENNLAKSSNLQAADSINLVVSQKDSAGNTTTRSTWRVLHNSCSAWFKPSVGQEAQKVFINSVNTIFSNAVYIGYKETPQTFWSYGQFVNYGNVFFGEAGKEIYFQVNGKTAFLGDISTSSSSKAILNGSLSVGIGATISGGITSHGFLTVNGTLSVGEKITAGGGILVNGGSFESRSGITSCGYSYFRDYSGDATLMTIDPSIRRIEMQTDFLIRKQDLGSAVSITRQGQMDVYIPFYARSTKSAVQKTKSFGDLVYYCEEAPTSYFTDYGHADKIGFIAMEQQFIESVSMEYEYYVFLQPCANGKVFLSERRQDGFFVDGDNIPFLWRICARRKDTQYEAQKKLRRVSAEKRWEEHRFEVLPEQPQPILSELKPIEQNKETTTQEFSEENLVEKQDAFYETISSPIQQEIDWTE